MFKTLYSAAVLMAATAAHSAVGVSVNRPIICNPDSSGRCTCMQDVAMLDDVTMALVTNAPDSDAADAVDFVRAIKPDQERGWNANSPRIMVLAMAGATGLPSRSIVVARRADVARYSKFLVPIMKLDGGVDATSKGVTLRPIPSDERAKVRDSYTDVCSTTDKRQWCIRIEGIGKNNTPEMLFQSAGFGHNLIDIFMPHTPSIGSPDWNKMFMSIQVELIDRTPIAIDGARVVRARPIGLVVHNVDVILSTTLGAPTQKPAGQ
ncbi:hypothetical protein [Roseateles sp. MS654]|uniref:hypothetical protein n=1 Tax=Roseateles sp. MS654 TaxID=3412685 RepID=UPI003C2FCE57